MSVPAPTVKVTRLLGELRGGNREAFDELLPIVYDELRRLARHKLRGGRAGATLNTTALVHEAYFKLVDHHAVEWQGRTHFFAVAARAMRQVVIDRARRRQAQKRGGDATKITLDESRIAVDAQAGRLLVLDAALDRLEQLDERQAQVVEYRFFGGLTIEEAAAALDISPSTVKRDWRVAKAWLAREMKRLESV